MELPAFSSAEKSSEDRSLSGIALSSSAALGSQRGVLATRTLGIPLGGLVKASLRTSHHGVLQGGSKLDEVMFAERHDGGTLYHLPRVQTGARFGQYGGESSLDVVRDTVSFAEQRELGAPHFRGLDEV